MGPDCRDLLGMREVVWSMSAMGYGADNAVVDSILFPTRLNLGLVANREAPCSSRRLQRDLATWIGGSVNREHHHSLNGSIALIDYGQRLIATPALILVNAGPISMNVLQGRLLVAIGCGSGSR